MRRFAVLLTLITSFATPLFAFGATIEPSASDLTVMPGEKATATILVKNDTDLLRNYDISFVEAVFGKQAEEISFTALAGDLKTAISALPSTFILEPHSSRTIDISVSLPTGVDAQSPTVVILVTEKGNSTSVGNVQASVASMLFIHVPGRMTRSMIIDSFAATPAVTFGKSTMISAVFQNDGEETIILPNEVRIIGPFGREVGRGQLSNEPKHLPPGTIRGVSLNWPAKTGFSKFLLGSYRFELWDGDAKLAQTFVTFIPPIVIFGAVLALALVLLGIISLVRRRT